MNIDWKEKLLPIIKYFIVIVISMFTGIGISIGLDLNGDEVPDVTIVLAENQVEGEPTHIESVDGGKFEEEVPDLGQGNTYDISSPEVFKNGVLGKCIDLDGKWGSQCVDGFAVFHYQYTGRWLSTAGTGAAKGLWDAKDYNAGTEYKLIENLGDVVPGTWIVTSSGVYGHVALALSGVHDGYITVLGENQGGKSCPGGGAAFNIINLSVKDFRGGFLPKIWEPKIEVPSEPSVVENTTCERYEVQSGDTLGEIMKRCEGEVDWSRMDDYAKSWVSSEVEPGQTVYAGWNSSNGVGLYAGDVIVRQM